LCFSRTFIRRGEAWARRSRREVWARPSGGSVGASEPLVLREYAPDVPTLRTPIGCSWAVLVTSHADRRRLRPKLKHVPATCRWRAATTPRHDRRPRRVDCGPARPGRKDVSTLQKRAELYARFDGDNAGYSGRSAHRAGLPSDSESRGAVARTYRRRADSPHGGQGSEERASQIRRLSKRRTVYRAASPAGRAHPSRSTPRRRRSTSGAAPRGLRHPGPCRNYLAQPWRDSRGSPRTSCHSCGS